MKNTNLFVTILVILLIIGGGYYYFEQTKTQPAQQEVNQQQTTTSLENSNNNIAQQDWKTLKSDTYGFSVSFPKTYLPIDGKDDFVFEWDLGNGTIQNISNEEIYIYCKNSKIISQNCNNLVFDEKLHVRVTSSTEKEQGTLVGEVNVNGYKLTSREFCSLGGEGSAGEDSGCATTYSYTQGKNRIEITFPKKASELSSQNKEILNTFSIK